MAATCQLGLAMHACRKVCLLPEQAVARAPAPAAAAGKPMEVVPAAKDGRGGTSADGMDSVTSVGIGLEVGPVSWPAAATCCMPSPTHMTVPSLQLLLSCMSVVAWQRCKCALTSAKAILQTW